jgi:hypothetical protein
LKHIQFATRLAALLLAVVASPITLADEDHRELRVEIIVFSYHAGDADDSEFWPLNPGLPALGRAVSGESGDPREAPAAHRLGSADLRLEGVRKRLDDSGDYRVLLHQGWRVEEQEAVAAPLLRIHLDQRDEQTRTREALRAERRAPTVFADPHLMPAETGISGEDMTAALTPARPLDGTLSVFRNRFFHASVDLLFNPEVDAEDAREDTLQQRQRLIEDILAGRIGVEELEDIRERREVESFLGYRLSDRRRVRLGELHYFDHPRFGVILRVERP